MANFLTHRTFDNYNRLNQPVETYFGEAIDTFAASKVGALGDVATADATQPRLYGGKELERMHGLNEYDFAARRLPASLPQWTTPDPCLEQYYPLSPYAYCAADPLRYTDPSGKRLIQVNTAGKVVLDDQQQYKDYDRFEVVENVNGKNTIKKDEGGKNMVLNLKEGSLISYTHITDEDDGHDIFKVKGDKNGEKLFQFFGINLAKPKKIEFSLAQTGREGNEGINFVSTSHDRKSEASMSHLFYQQLRHGYYIRTLAHSHPEGLGPSKADKRFKKNTSALLNAANLHIPDYKLLKIKNGYGIYFKY